MLNDREKLLFEIFVMWIPYAITFKRTDIANIDEFFEVIDEFRKTNTPSISYDEMKRLWKDVGEYNEKNLLIHKFAEKQELKKHGRS